MASLHILKGVNQGQRITLDAELIVMGRSRDCQVVIPLTSVSRQHARIVRLQGRYHIEDMKSRNGTKVNGQTISQRTPLNNGDQIQICDFHASFHDLEHYPLPPEAVRPDQHVDGESTETSSTIRAQIAHDINHVLEITSLTKLRMILSATNKLSRTLEQDQLLPRIAEVVFELFAQADRCFVILCGEGTGELLQGAVKTRRPQEEATAASAPPSSKRSLQSSQGYLSEDAQADLPDSSSILGGRIRSVLCAPLCDSRGQDPGCPPGGLPGPVAEADAARIWSCSWGWRTRWRWRSKLPGSMRT